MRGIFARAHLQQRREEIRHILPNENRGDDADSPPKFDDIGFGTKGMFLNVQSNQCLLGVGRSSFWP